MTYSCVLDTDDDSDSGDDSDGTDSVYIFMSIYVHCDHAVQCTLCTVRNRVGFCICFLINYVLRKLSNDFL